MAALGEVFHTSILSLLSLQDNLVLCKFFSVLWAIWGQRNNRVWGRQALPSEVAVMTALLEISTIQTMQNRTKRDEHKYVFCKNSFTKP